MAGARRTSRIIIRDRDLMSKPTPNVVSFFFDRWVKAGAGLTLNGRSSHVSDKSVK
jgi:hypothetical protein